MNEPELMNGPARAPHAMPAICGTPQIKTGKMCQVDQHSCGPACGRRGGQQHGFRLQARNPEYRLSIGRLQRVAWEIATPSAVRRFPGSLRLETCGGSRVRNRDDSHHRDADTPRRSLRREYFSHVDKPPPSANRCRACGHPLILRPCVALRPDGEFWLRDRLFEDGIVEYVDRGSRSGFAIILLTLFA